MQRRNFLIGAAGTAIGSSALVGSGAFSSVSANREVNIEVASDEDALLSIEPADTHTGDAYAENDGGTVSLDFTQTSGVSGNPEGLNPDAGTSFREVLKLTNQGSDDIYLGADTDNIENITGIDAFNVFFYTGDGSPRGDGSGNPEGEPRINGPNAPVQTGPRPLVVREEEDAKLTPGNEGYISFYVKTNNKLSGDWSARDLVILAATPDRTPPSE